MTCHSRTTYLMCCDFLLKYFPFYSMFCVLGGCQGCGFINFQRGKAFNRICWVKQEWSTIANLLQDPKHANELPNNLRLYHPQRTYNVSRLRLVAKKGKNLKLTEERRLLSTMLVVQRRRLFCICVIFQTTCGWQELSDHGLSLHLPENTPAGPHVRFIWDA